MSSSYLGHTQKPDHCVFVEGDEVYFNINGQKIHHSKVQHPTRLEVNALVHAARAAYGKSAPFITLTGSIAPPVTRQRKARS